jgi:tetratricopeptide (TPR) repeat protein
MKNRLLIIFVIVPLICFAYDFEDGGIRNAALGITGIGSSQDASAAVWNPSQLSVFKYYELITDSRPYLMQLDNDNISQIFTYFTFPVGKVPGAFAVSGGFFNSEAYDEGRFGMHYGASIFPQKLEGKLSAGISLYDYYLNYSEINESKNAFDLDIGFSYHLNDIFRFGLITRNLTRCNLALEDGAEDRLPIVLGIGSNASWKKFNFIGELEFEKYCDNNELLLGLGMEYMLAKNLFLRAGMNNHNFTGGFGLKIFAKNWPGIPTKSNKANFSFMEIAVDYAFHIPISASKEGDTFAIGNDLKSEFGDHFFGVKIDFGKSKATKDEMVELFPGQFGVDLDVRIDTVFVEKVVIDTLVHEKTVYDTIRIIEKIIDSEMITEKIQEETTKVHNAEMANINRATVHLIDALEYYYSQDYYKAIQECEQAIFIAPELSLSYIRLASIYYRMGDTEEALYHLKRAQRIDPENPELKRMMDILSND